MTYMNTINVLEPISKLLKRVTPAKVSARKRAESTG